MNSLHLFYFLSTKKIQYFLKKEIKNKNVKTTEAIGNIIVLNIPMKFSEIFKIIIKREFL